MNPSEVLANPGQSSLTVSRTLAVAEISEQHTPHFAEHYIDTALEMAHVGEYEGIRPLTTRLAATVDLPKVHELISTLSREMARNFSAESLAQFLSHVKKWEGSAVEILAAKVIEEFQSQPVATDELACELVGCAARNPYSRLSGAACAWLGASAADPSEHGYVARSAIATHANELHSVVASVWDPVRHYASVSDAGSLHPCIVLARIIGAHCSPMKKGDLARSLLNEDYPPTSGSLLLALFSPELNPILPKLWTQSIFPFEQLQKLVIHPSVGHLVDDRMRLVRRSEVDEQNALVV